MATSPLFASMPYLHLHISLSRFWSHFYIFASVFHSTGLVLLDSLASPKGDFQNVFWKPVSFPRRKPTGHWLRSNMVTTPSLLTWSSRRSQQTIFGPFNSRSPTHDDNSGIVDQVSLCSDFSLHYETLNRVLEHAELGGRHGLPLSHATHRCSRWYGDSSPRLKTTITPKVANKHLLIRACYTMVLDMKQNLREQLRSMDGDTVGCRHKWQRLSELATCAVFHVVQRGAPDQQKTCVGCTKLNYCADCWTDYRVKAWKSWGRIHVQITAWKDLGARYGWARHPWTTHGHYRATGAALWRNGKGRSLKSIFEGLDRLEYSLPDDPLQTAARKYSIISLHSSYPTDAAVENTRKQELQITKLSRGRVRNDIVEQQRQILREMGLWTDKEQILKAGDEDEHADLPNWQRAITKAQSAPQSLGAEDRNEDMEKRHIVTFRPSLLALPRAKLTAQVETFQLDEAECQELESGLVDAKRIHRITVG